MSNFSRRLKSTFSSRKKVWQQLAHDLKAEYVDEGIFKSPVIHILLEDGKILLDSFSKHVGRNQQVYTRFVTDCINRKGLQFRVDRKTILNKKAPKGMETILSEYADFDKRFRLYTSNRREVNQILNRQILRNIAEQQPFNDIRIELKNNELTLRIASLNKDLLQLKSLVKLVETIRLQLENEF